MIAHHLHCCCTVQVYHQVHQMLPDVHYNALAKILILKTPGKRKQERLPGKQVALHPSVPAFCILLCIHPLSFVNFGYKRYCSRTSQWSSGVLL